MIDLRPFATLGGENHGWLDAKHHFSFANYQDPKRMNWGNLRVWNDDEIAARSGFPPHPHRDMEIITYVREGAITHQDSMGNKGRTAAGDERRGVGTAILFGLLGFGRRLGEDRLGLGRPFLGARCRGAGTRCTAWTVAGPG